MIHHSENADSAHESSDGFLSGLRVLEVADELGEYCGKVLAGLGADVIKVEPPGGEITRTYGPFFRDVPNPDRSLYFWHYNFGKRGIELDLDSPAGCASFAGLASTADVILDSRARGYMAERKLSYDDLRSANPGLVYARISPFGDDGPWADFRGSDLVHLALGGVSMNCGYTPDLDGCYETPPIAPQVWHSYHVTGEMVAMGIIAAINYRTRSGAGQFLSTAVHEAVSKATETDLPNWIFRRTQHFRQTAQHSMPVTAPAVLAATKDGRWLLPYRTYLPGVMDTWDGTVRLLRRFGMQEDLDDERFQDPEVRATAEAQTYIAAVTDRLVNRLMYDRDLWLEAQKEGLTWAPIRRPEENAGDAHWRQRGTFVDVRHPELDATFTYVRGAWESTDAPWRSGPRAPLVGEHTAAVLAEVAQRPAVQRPVNSAGMPPAVISKRGKPFALSGVRIIDLSWMLASGGAGRFFTSLGAEVIRVEHESRPDGMRFTPSGRVPGGGRRERDEATESIPVPPLTSPNQGGSFMEINAGKRSLSLNLKSPRGKEILAELLKDADMVIEGFSPGTMDRMGFGYTRLRTINPDIIYVQQSGMGQHGIYGSLRSYGPTAQALSGITEMSGLPEPFPPAGIGYSYLDWFGAYNMALAMMAALYRKRASGKGCYIDSSQVETGLYLTGTAVLDHSVNGRRWSRFGNRSPYKLAAPHGNFPAFGEDRWIAIACFTEDDWRKLVGVLDRPEWAADPRFSTLTARLEHQDELECLVSEQTRRWEAEKLMNILQEAGTPAGVCQTAQDRLESDPQLAHLDWLVELSQTEIGTWPVKESPVKYSETPSYMGGVIDRSGPNYGEDTDYVLSTILGFDAEEINRLRADGVV